MKIISLILTLVLCGSVMLLQGCMVAAVGAGAAGTVAYFKGDLESVEAASLDAVWQATLSAVEEMELYVISKEKDALGASLTLRDAADKKISIELATVTEDSTRVSIRVGVFGDERKSQMIYSKIKENLRGEE